MVLRFILAFLLFTLPTELWAESESNSALVLVGVNFDKAQWGNSTLKNVRLHEGVLSADLGEKKISAQQLIGASFLGKGNVHSDIKLKICNIVSDPQDPDLLYYQFDYWRPSAHEWQNICLPDFKGEQKAVLINGVWDEKGHHIQSESLFTVGCTSSAIGKCVKWGYKPWKSVKGRSLEPFHQACTRMVRADYLGDGNTQTLDGTEIFFTDILGVNSFQPPPHMKLEATWGINGAIQIFKLRIPALREDFNGQGEILITSYSKDL